ncbi:Vitamin B12 transporter BtuB [Asticcacaulis sp. MM231]|uniref:TonB-dependent receptor plug domain-containing protein n=1 Tax=Asticcacaulis sp. MM231 TaxID=3157666 RepID=UPI0032D5AE4D
MRKFTQSLCAATAALPLMLAAVHASAQSIDYGSLESLFNEPVTTSATGSPQRAAQASANIEIITAEDIDRSGARTIPDILAQVTGMDVRRSSMGGVDVNVRGYNQPMSGKLLVLINGRQVYLDHYGFTYWDALPVELAEIRQIEVVKGPNTALFGFNAVSGVVNIITYSPLNDKTNAVAVRGGSQSLGEVSLVTTFKLGSKVGIRLSGGTYTADEFSDANAAVPGIPSSPRRNSFSADGIIQLTPKTQLELEATYSDMSRMSETPFFASEVSNGNTKSLRGSVISETKFGLVKANVYSNHFWNTLHAPNRFIFGNEVVVAQAEDLLKIGANHTVRLAVEHRDNHATGAFETAKIQITSGSAMWSWQVSDALNWTNAIRYDTVHQSYQYIGKRYDATGFNSTVVYKATDKDTWRFSAARGVSAPSLIDLSANVTEKPMFVSNAEVSYSHHIDAVRGNVRLSAFTEKFTDVKGFNPGLTTNFGDSSSSGFEAEITGKTGDHLDWKLGYIYQSVDDKLDNTTNGIVYTQPGAYEPGTSKGIVVGQVRYATGAWDFGLFAHSVSESDQLYYVGTGYLLDHVPSYVSTGARVAYKINPKLTMELAGQDLTNNKTKQFSLYRIESRTYLTLKARY